MQSSVYLQVTNQEVQIRGGQELLLPELLSIILPVVKKGVWLPCCPEGSSLVQALHKQGVWVDLRYSRFPQEIPECDVVYLGTPTIVNDTPLFSDSVPSFDYSWTKQSERWMVRSVCGESERAGYKLIVTGLGSGDISVEERLADMGGGEVVCFKKFETFSDWILVREINQKT